ncbi:MAG: tRNA lysidine(34) synthetase TilS, partial [Burkholderiales bacterium]
LEEALRQCLESAPDSRVQVHFGAVSIRRHRGRIALVEDVEEALDWEGAWQGEDTLCLPDGLGRMRFVRTTGDGISQARLDSAPVSVRFRRGGEKLSLGRGRPRRDLKHLLQEAGVPQWERGRLPLLFCGELLAWVPGIGVSAECVANEGEPAIRVEWERP